MTVQKVTTSIRVLVPDDTRNYIKNPAIRQDTTGWVSSGSAISRATNRARFGFSSLKVITNGLANSEGAYYRVQTLSALDESCTVSVYVRGDGEVRIRLINAGGSEWASPKIDLTDERWTRIEVNGRCQTTNDVRLYVETAQSTPQAVTFYVDGAQMELHPYSTTYCDGEQEGCKWTALFDGSESIRPLNTRLGGRWEPITGPLRDFDDDIYATLITGAGMAPLDVNSQSYATKPGGHFENIKVNMRTLQLTFRVKDGSGESASIERLHHLKQELTDILKPDRVYGDEPITLEYTVADNPPLYIRARYDGGLEGAWDVRNKWSNGFVLRMIAEDPFWYEDSQELTELDFSDTEVDNTVGIARKSGVDGSWDFVPIPDDIYKMVEGPDGTLYFATLTKVYTYDGDTVVTINGPAGKEINDMTVSIDGVIWIVTDAFGVYYYSAGWTSVIAGSALTVTTGISVDVNGDIYVCGTVNDPNQWPFQRFDGATWHFPGAASGASFSTYPGGGASPAAYQISISPDRRYIYCTGAFFITYSTGTQSGGILKYSIEEDTFLDEISNAYAIDTSLHGVYFLYVTKDNRLYIDSANGGDLSILYFNGSSWTLVSYPDGFEWVARNLNSQIVGYKDAILVGGVVDGTTDVNNLLFFKSSVFLDMDFRVNPLLGTNTGALLVRDNGDLYISSRVGSYSGSTTVENVGSASVLPQIYVKGYGILNNIENGTEDVRLFFDMLVQSSEEVLIDFGKGTIQGVQNRNRINTLRSGSDLSEFSLIPGNNAINTFIRNDVNAEARIAYIPRHWSVDAVARKEAI